MNVTILEFRTCVRHTDVQSTHGKVFEHVFALSGAFDVHPDFEITPLGQILEHQCLIVTYTQLKFGRTVSNSRCQFIATELGATIKAVGHISFAGGNFLNLLHSSESCSLATWSLLRNSSFDVPVFLMTADRNDMI